MKLKQTVLKYSASKAWALVLLLAIALLAGCGDRAGAPAGHSTATLTEATMCKTFSPELGAGEKTTVFSANDWIICSVKVSGASPGTEVKAVWLYEGQPKAEDVQYCQGTSYLMFKLEPSDGNLSAGDYTVTLYLNGVEKITLPFRVE